MFTNIIALLGYYITLAYTTNSSPAFNQAMYIQCMYVENGNKLHYASVNDNIYIVNSLSNMCRTQADIKTVRFERGELSQEQQTFLKVYSFNKELYNGLNSP